MKKKNDSNEISGVLMSYFLTLAGQITGKTFKAAFVVPVVFGLALTMSTISHAQGAGPSCVSLFKGASVADSVGSLDFLDNDADLPRPEQVGYDDESVNYATPNELRPRDQAFLFRDAPYGLHVAVGSERGFIGAALNPKATHLLLIDRGTSVSAFNRINIMLLKLAHNRRDYVFLRKKADLSVWQQRMAEISDTRILSAKEIELLNDPNTFNVWRKEMKEDFNWTPIHRRPLHPLAPFADANYLYNNELFDKLSSMAKEGRMQVLQLDLYNAKNLAFVMGRLQAQGIQLSVLDLSNAWWSCYMNEGAFLATVQMFQNIARPNSVLELTEKRVDASVLAEMVTGELKWFYFGTHFSQLGMSANANGQSDAASFIEKLDSHHHNAAVNTINKTTIPELIWE